MSALKIAIGPCRFEKGRSIISVIASSLVKIVHELVPEYGIAIFGSRLDQFDEWPFSLYMDHIDIKGFQLQKTGTGTIQGMIEYAYQGQKICDDMCRSLQGYDVIVVERDPTHFHPVSAFAFYFFVQWCLKNDPSKRIIFRMYDILREPEKIFKPHDLSSEILLISDWRSIFYPLAPNVSYIAGSSVKYRELASLGIDRARIHYLPACLDVCSEETSKRDLRTELESRFNIAFDARIIFSSVKCVPENNVEEAILITVLLNHLRKQYELLEDYGDTDKPFHLVVAQTGTDENEAYSRAVREFVRDNNLPVTIGVEDLIAFGEAGDGIEEKYSLADMYVACRMAITTAMSEKNPYIYLEPWLYDCLLIGRDNPVATVDFKQVGGMKLGHLYDILRVGDIDFVRMGENHPVRFPFSIIEPSSFNEEKLNFVSEMDKNEKVRNAFLNQNEIQMKRLICLLAEGRFAELIIHNKKAVKKTYSSETVLLQLRDILIKHEV